MVDDLRHQHCACKRGGGPASVAGARILSAVVSAGGCTLKTHTTWRCQLDTSSEGCQPLCTGRCKGRQASRGCPPPALTASSPPSAKSRAMFFFGRDSGTESTHSYSACSSCRSAWGSGGRRHHGWAASRHRRRRHPQWRLGNGKRCHLPPHLFVAVRERHRKCLKS